MATQTFTSDGIILVGYYWLNGRPVARPKSLKREQIFVRTDYGTISGKTMRDISSRKESYILEWEVLTKEEADVISGIVDLNCSVAFEVSDGNLQVGSVDVFPRVKAKHYTMQGENYFVSLVLELLAEEVV
jgi:hypothetical protein